jgi:hypothetical protein
MARDPSSLGAGSTVESQGPSGDEGQGTSPPNLREAVEIVPACLWLASALRELELSQMRLKAGVADHVAGDVSRL